MNSRITAHHLLLSNLLKLTQAHHLEQSGLEESMDGIEHHLENMNVHFFSNFLAGHFGLMPSPSASSKFGSSILKFFKHTQNHFGILKS